ncbi:uncharacterized protein LOC102804474 [Saccoglossus kowalevskii]
MILATALGNKTELGFDTLGSGTVYEENNFNLLSGGDELSFGSAQFDSDIEVDLTPRKTSTPERPPTLKRRRISQPIQNPLRVLSKECCEEKCLDSLSKNDVISSERCFKMLPSETSQSQFILDTIREHSFTKTVKDKVVVETNLILKGKRVCPKSWQIVHNVTEDRWKSCKDKFIQGIITITHKNCGRTGSRDKTTAAIGWMRFLFERIGDYMPHNSEIHLPCCYSKTSLHARMRNEFLARGISENGIICYDHFTRVWKMHLPEFKICKKSGFAKCTICTNLKELYEKATTNFEREKINGLLKLHMDQVEKERKRYHYHREKAEKEPEELLTIIIDGMDQNKTDLPHLMTEDKATSNLLKLRTHITGSIVHTGVTSGKIPFAHIDVNQIPHDSNLTMNILLDVLSEVKTHLAKVLYLQLDNCFRENKNRFLLSLMELMVEINVFEEIFVSFLPVGHTHENVDQMFSKISTKLGHRNTYTIDDLEETVTASYTPPIKSCGLLKKPLYNIKDWLLPHITGKMQGHSKPHNFRFHKVGGRAYMQYRLWCTDKWQPTTIDANGDQVPGLRCLKSIPGRDDVPSFVIPSLEKMDADALNLDIPRRYGMRLPVAAVQWWNDFFTNVKELEKVPSETPSSWILYDLKDHAVEKRNLRNQIEDPRVGQNVMDIEERLTLPCPRVTVTGGMPVMADHVDNYNSIAVNDMIAIYCPEYDEIPQIGKVLSRDDDKFIIHWYKGSWRTAWKPFYLFQGRKRVPYQDEEPVEAAIYWGFSLNGRNMLSKETQIILHEKYDDVIVSLQD